MENQKRIVSNRILVCDPVCVLPFGHNVPLIRNFRAMLGPYFEETHLLGCKRLPEAIARENGIRGIFEYCYNDAMPLPSGQCNDDLPQDHFDKMDVAKSDIKELIAQYDVNAQDVLCYPSVDFYSLLALAECSDNLVRCGGPVIMLRLIGVMENAGPGTNGQREAAIIASIQTLRNAGLTIKISAETPKYAAYLARQLDCTVFVTANIDTREQIALPFGKAFHVICPGSARYDKGFLHLRDIFKAVRRLDPDIRVRFTTQILPDIDLRYQIKYLSQLYAIPGVTLLPSKLTATQLASMYDDADLVLLPYAKDVYEYRGSAVLIEAICAGRPVIAFEGSAFVDQMRFFGAGDVCANEDEMADLIMAYSKMPPKQRFTNARQARKRFERDLTASYQDWVM